MNKCLLRLHAHQLARWARIVTPFVEQSTDTPAARKASLRWKAKDSGKTPPLPSFDFFLPEVDIQKILTKILLGW